MKYINTFLLLLLLVVACSPDDKETLTPIPVPDIFDVCMGKYSCTIRTYDSWVGEDTTTSEIVNIEIISKTDSTLRIWTDTFSINPDTTLTLYSSTNYSLTRTDSRFYGNNIFIMVTDRLKSPSKGYFLYGSKL